MMKPFFLSITTWTFILLASFFISQPVLAHTKWFADGMLSPLATTEPLSLYIAVWGGIIITTILIAALLQRFQWLELPALNPTRPHSFDRAASGFTMMVGAYFVIAGSHEYFLTPNLSVENGLPFFFILVQILVGLALLIGLGARIAALVLAATWILSFWYTGFISGIENIWLLSTTIFIALMGNDYFSLYSNEWLRKTFVPFKRYSLSILRIGTGVTLMVLGLSEKIMAPEYGINFLLQYNWNFMAILGLPYSDLLFTISAGSVEFLFGALIALGLLTRLTVFVVAIVFTIPMFILGPIELTGHLPHFAALIIILLYGNGGHILPLTPKKYRLIK